MSYSVTLEIPDALYHKFKVRSQRANRSLEDEFLTAFAVDLPVLPSTETAVIQAYEEILDFLAGGPSPFDIIQFRLSDSVVQQAQLLLEKEREHGLTDAEAQELDAHVALGDFLGILRAKAPRYLRPVVNN